VQSLEDCSVFFESVLEDMDLSWSGLGMLGLWQKLSWISGQSLATCPVVHKRGKACCQDSADIPVELAFHLSQVSKKGQEWWTSSVWKLSPCLGRAGVVIVLFVIGRTFARLVIRPERVRLLLDLFPKDPEAWVSWESSPFHSSIVASIAWMSFRNPVRVFGLLWWTILSLIHLASPL